MTGRISNHRKFIHFVIQNRCNSFPLLCLGEVPPAAKEKVQKFCQNSGPVVGEDSAKGFPQKNHANPGKYGDAL